MKFDGAGVFIIEKYFNGKKWVNCITLFGKKGGKFDDPGGHIDKGETPEKAAYRELREETANLITIDKHFLKKSYYVNVKRYKCFIVYVKGLSKKQYYVNRKHIDMKCKRAHSWKETNEMIRVPIKNMLHMINLGNNYVYDTDGIKRKIRGRTIGIFKRSIDIMRKLLSSKHKPIKLKKKKVLSSRMLCLRSMYTFRIE